MPHKRHQLAIAIASATVALGLLLAGCSGSSGDTSNGSSGPSASSGSSEDSSGASDSGASEAASDQTKADACALVQSSFEEFSTVSSQVDANNPQAAIDAFAELSDKTTDALASITNAEVKPAATKASTALGEYVAFLQTVVADPSKAGDMSAEVTDLQSGFTEVATICAG